MDGEKELTGAYPFLSSQGNHYCASMVSDIASSAWYTELTAG